MWRCGIHKEYNLLTALYTLNIVQKNIKKIQGHPKTFSPRPGPVFRCQQFAEWVQCPRLVGHCPHSVGERRQCSFKIALGTIHILWTIGNWKQGPANRFSSFAVQFNGIYDVIRLGPLLVFNSSGSALSPSLAFLFYVFRDSESWPTPGTYSSSTTAWECSEKHWK